MNQAKLWLCAVCAVVFVSMSPVLTSAEPGAVLARAEQANVVVVGSAATTSNRILLPMRAAGPFSAAIQVAACTGLGDPCKKNSQCCTGKCVKGFDEGRPGAWCDNQ